MKPIVKRIESIDFIAIKRLGFQTVIKRIVQFVRKDFVILQQIVVWFAGEKQRRQVKGVDENIFLIQERLQIPYVMFYYVMAAKTVAISYEIHEFGHQDGMEHLTWFHTAYIKDSALTSDFQIYKSYFQHLKYRIVQPLADNLIKIINPWIWLK